MIRVDVGGFMLATKSIGKYWRSGELAQKLELYDPFKQKVVGIADSGTRAKVKWLVPPSERVGGMYVEGTANGSPSIPIGSLVSTSKNGITYLAIITGHIYGNICKAVFYKYDDPLEKLN